MQSGEARGLENKPYNIISAANIRFPYHIHRTFEVLHVIRGTAQACVDGNSFSVAAGECAVVFPLQYHSYAVDGHSAMRIYIFSPDFMPEYTALTANRVPVNAHVTLPQAVFEGDPPADLLYAKAFFYRMCAQLNDTLALRAHPKAQQKHSLLDEIFLYVDQNYYQPCKLKDLSDALNYDYTYLSKHFKQKTGETYNHYLNHFRVNKACYLLINEPAVSVTEIAHRVGFSSIRTFNREFLQITGTTPQQFRYEEV